MTSFSQELMTKPVRAKRSGHAARSHPFDDLRHYMMRRESGAFLPANNTADMG
jgi:hypothetical protein